MSGFVATADPRETNDFRVTRAIVHDPLYPHGNAVWGRSPAPGEAITVATLGRQFVPRRTSNRLRQPVEPARRASTCWSCRTRPT